MAKLLLCNLCVFLLLVLILSAVSLVRGIQLNEVLEWLGEGKWIWNKSSKERTFDDPDDPSQLWRACFRDHAPEIHAEFLAFEQNHSYAGLVGDYAGNTEFDPSGHKWHQVPLDIYNAESPEAEAFFPVTTACLHQSPLVTLLFSILDPWSSISPHTGTTYTILRYQLNLELPKYSPGKDEVLPLYGAKQCAQKPRKAWGKLEPGDTCFQAPVHLGVYDSDWTHVKYYEWTQYNDLIFDDMHLHFVQNMTPERRVVMWGDVPRYDVPWYLRIVLGLMHMIVPHFHPEVIEAINHTEESLRRHAGLPNHFVRRYSLPYLCIRLGSFLVAAVIAVRIVRSMFAPLRSKKALYANEAAFKEL